MSWNSPSPSGSSDHSLLAFTRSREVSEDYVQAESSTSGEKRGGSSGPRYDSNLETVLPRTPSLHQASRSHKDDLAGPEIHVSKKPRTSGGFLLEPKSAPSRLAFLSRSKNETSNIKGKEKREGSGLLISKRRNRHSHRSSIGSSPLATKVSTLEDDADVCSGSPAWVASDLRRSVGSGSNVKDSPTPQDESQTTGSTLETNPVGYDTDPMQIVNLALSLSEGRRRQASGMRVVSGNSEIRRSISTSQRSNLLVARPQSNIGQYLHSDRQFSRNISPRAQGHGQPVSINAQRKSRIPGSYLQPPITDHTDYDLHDDLYDVSDATIARVQKAKNHFELLYEHRRLLSHLPPLRPPTQSPRKSDSEGRAYNPLQYVRNRKVRFPERKSIESDAEGWHDVQQVRAWVDAIIEGHNERRHDPDECIRLPEMHHLHTERPEEGMNPKEVASPSSMSHKRDANPPGKHYRLRSDWIVSPGDVLADIYWLEQGSNKTKIEDRDGNKIYPRNAKLKFTDWRNRNPAHGQGSQQSSHPPESAENNKPQPSVPLTPPELPSFTSTGRKGKHRRRGRRRDVKRGVDSDSENSDSESRKKSKRLRRTLMRPRSKSSSSDSDDEKSSQSPVKDRNRENERIAAESGKLDHYMRKMLDRDTIRRSQSSVERARDSALPESQMASSRERAASKNRLKTDHLREAVRNSLDRRRQSRPSLDIERPARASLDGDTTAPSSPSIHQFPSIAIDLSPPPSRSPSPPKRALHSRMNPFHDRTESKQRNGIDAADFADGTPPPPFQKESIQLEKNLILPNDSSRDTSPMTKSARRTSVPSVPSVDPQRTYSTASKTSAKIPNSPDATSRIRGMFKGGRIAELVGNEVSRVGDFIWKREPPSATRTSSSASSLKSQPGSDAEEEVLANGRVSKRLPQPHSGRSSASAEGTGKIATSGQARSGPKVGEKPALFMNNLPSFTSPFQKDREVQEERDRAALLVPESSPTKDSDHISNAAPQFRSVSKSLRLERLAPPKLNISRTNSPAGSPDRRRDGYDFSKPLVHPPVTGLTSLKASRSGGDLAGNWDPSVRDPSIKPASIIITKKDIARARALLLSSGAKARQISLRAHSIPSRPPRILLDIVEPQPQSPEALQSLLVPRKDEPVLAARSLISTLATQSNNFRTSLEHFTSTTSPSLHTSLQALDDLVENTLTPRVRAAADESGELSTKLTTTSTLAIKALNDVIEGAMRRRRKSPVRRLRRLGYAIVEWLVVGLLWGIWGVVSLVRVVVGVLGGIWRALRWLVWLD
ncbi:hypothetical protein EPUS_00185 [Endocarpon pusillum Z07020]|uniref:Uncharacterized protein n=1 Tax=Endocarpon pusillum (strain Z07020 / HMAS-L-300199) TaxID=1263415 RepID=U1GCS7_ENDPU|nr:uncharacterized protein EPUS_00185 [Endocarpon pusillum Z07020]ERF75392.1 hypothetical protein EPUS_00185 [Endocarpon pusillum Z07020]